MLPIVSVIVCTHNPREDYLHRVLSALRAQTLHLDLWEVLLIDNASEKPLVDRCDLGWHPNAKHIREDELGLTPARLRGIRESQGELLVFVDDDNLLDNDYLEAALKISSTCPHVGAFNGSARGEYEAEPPAWLTAHLVRLAVSEIDREYWSNLPFASQAQMPFGAGLCVRRNVAEDYQLKTTADARRRTLDRSGKNLGCAGDTDIAWCALDLAMGVGRFPALRLTHLIPKRRLTREYVLGVIAGHVASTMLLVYFRTGTVPGQFYPHQSPLRFLLAWLRAKKFQRHVLFAEKKGVKSARRIMSSCVPVSRTEHGAKKLS